MKKEDIAGRRLASNREPDPRDGKPHATKCDLYTFERLDWHGNLPLDHIHKLNRECGRVNKNILQKRQRILSTVRDTADGARYLYCPNQQFPNLPGGYIPNNLHLVYHLDEGAKKALKERYIGYAHGGPYAHQLAQAIVGAEIEIGSYSNREYTFIPHHRVTAVPNSHRVYLSELDKDTTLEPDIHFQIDYVTKKQHFFVEVDLGTETLKGVYPDQKTVERSLRQYREFIGTRQYRDTLGTTDGAFLIFIFNDMARLKTAIETATSISGEKGNAYMLFFFDDRFDSKSFPAPMVSDKLWMGEYQRAGRSPVRINAPII